MAALALLTAACTNDDSELTAPQPAQGGGIPFEATISVDNGAATRALAESGNDLVATWAVGEKVALIHNGVSDEMEVASISGGVATISGTMTGSPANGDAVTVIYPASAVDATTKDVKADLLAAQDGTLTGTGGTSIAEKYDVRKSSGATLRVSGGKASLNGNVSLANQYAIFKLTLKDVAGTADKAATKFIVKDGSNNVLTTVTPGSATNVLYVALPALAAGTYWFDATVGDKPYIAKATVSTATTAGNYYQSTVKMATLGDLMGSDGKFYADGAAATAANTTPIGVIAYLGTDAFTETGTDVGGSTFTGHGLVLCLKNAASGVKWSTETGAYEFGESARVNNADALKRTTDVSGYTNTTTLAAKADAETKYPAAWQAKNYTGLAAPATGTTGWFLPSAQQWVKMQEGLGGLAEGDITWLSWFKNDHSAATAWETAMAKAGAKGTAYDSVTDDYLWYWSSSEYSAGIAVYLYIDATDTGTNYGFFWLLDVKGNSGAYGRVRPVLAF